MNPGLMHVRLAMVQNKQQVHIFTGESECIRMPRESNFTLFVKVFATNCLILLLFSQEMESHSVKMERGSQSQPWGFSIEGGQGSEYFSKDSSIVVTGIANGSPADGTLRYNIWTLMRGGGGRRGVYRHPHSYYTQVLPLPLQTRGIVREETAGFS